MGLKQISGPITLDIPTDPGALFLVRVLVERLTQRLDFPQEAGGPGYGGNSGR